MLVALLVAQALASDPPDATHDLRSWTSSRAQVADLDADGVGDVLLAVDGQMLLWSGTRGGPPLSPATSYATGGTVGSDLVPGDIDNDGLDDVLVVTRTGEVVGWAGQPGGPVQTWTVAKGVQRAFALGDIDGDGHHDALVDQTVWTGSPTGPVPAGPLPSGIVEEPCKVWALGDLNGDGFDDVAIRGEAEAIDWYGGVDADLIVLRGTAAGLDPIPWWTYSRPELDCGFDSTLADVDGDGTDELVITCLSASDQPGSGVIDVLDDITTASPTLLTSTPFRADVGDGWDMGALDDWNGDGVDELVLVVGGQVRELPWYPGTGLHLDDLGAQTWEAPYGTPRFLTTGDINGDGKRDLLVSRYDSATELGTATVWLSPAPVPPTETGDTSDTGDTPLDATGDTGVTTAARPNDKDVEGGCGCRQVRGPGLLGVWVRRR